jgi:CBS domain-containing protein
MLTDRDVCMAAYTRGQPLAAMSVRSTMSSPPQSVAPEESLGAVLRRMGERQLRRLAVTHEGRLVGVISLADVARHVRRRGRRSLPAQLALSRTLCDVSESRTAASEEGRTE